MKIVFITGGLSPYRIAFCDSINDYMKKNNIGELKMLLLSHGGFNSNYDTSSLERPYTEYVDGKTIVLRDNTTRFMINTGIVKKLKSENPDFIILGGSWAHPTTWLLLKGKKKINAPIYFWAESHFHNGLKRKKRRLWKELLKKFVYNKFDGFFAPGLYAKEAIESTNCRKKANCIQLPNLIENELYEKANCLRSEKKELRRGKNIPIENKVLFTPSRLVDLKGILEFIEGGKEKLKDSFTWIIAGMGPLEEEIKRKSVEYGLDIRLVGFIDQKSVVDYLAMSDWFLLPSLSDPNPLSVVEALWAGLPIVLSEYVGNTPETLVNDENGFVFDTLLFESVDNVLSKMSKADEEWLKLASLKSKRIAKEYFDINKETERLITGIERIVSHNE